MALGCNKHCVSACVLNKSSMLALLLTPPRVHVCLQLVQVEFVPAGKMLTREGMMPEQLVVVRQGAVQVTGGSLPGAQVFFKPHLSPQ